MKFHHQITAGSNLPDGPLTAGLPDPEILSPVPEQADARVVVRNHLDEIIAHAALWWTDVPAMKDHSIGAIGGFAAMDGESCRAVLDAACAHLSAKGCTSAVGPMNGNTWRRYRFVTEGDERQPFLLEPTNPAPYPEWWNHGGFRQLAQYSSSLLALPSKRSASAKLRQRLASSGVVVRPLDADRYHEELKAIHEVSLRSFAANFLYTPLDFAPFLQSYLKVRDHADPRFVRIAERDGHACGFVFAIADLNAVALGHKPAIIVKTLAVDPNSRCPGLGSLLVDEVHEAACAAGFTEAIHALQHETNTSLKITQRNAGTRFRRYTLFQKLL